jgi:hypothetical protein
MNALVKLELLVVGQVVFSGLWALACEAMVALMWSALGALRWKTL